jgi:ABC-type multidrug transport system fused ATPase/permease subunit
VEFDHVYLRYGSGDVPVLKGVSFVLQGGRKMGVVGRTGAGKSTVAAALFRLVEISSGGLSCACVHAYVHACSHARACVCTCL